MDNIENEQNSIEVNSQTIRNQLWTKIHSCVGLVSEDNKQIEALTRLLREHKQALMLDRGPTEQSRKNIEIVEELCGTVTQVDVCIRPHIVAKNKGSGKRIKGKREITIEAGAKRACRCHKCDQYGHHDCCNCTNGT
nr:protein FAR1-RELATED SEQUENCE 5-like [Ipomoea batatas]